MNGDLPQLVKPRRVIPLEYSGPDLPSDRRREVDAVARGFGGWLQIAMAVGLGVAGAFLGAWWCHFSGIACVASFLGVIGFSVGLFMRLPEDAPGWRRLCYGCLAAVALCGVCFWILPGRAGEVVFAIVLRGGFLVWQYKD